MADLQIFQRAARVFLTRLLMVCGPAAPSLLRPLARSVTHDALADLLKEPS